MKKILLIEDNELIKNNSAEILELAGYKVITACDGKEGVAAAVKEMPDLVICDIMMPGLDGYGVLMMLQNNSLTNQVPFIFLTAKTDRSDLRKGMEMGADDYITKPFTGSELLNAVERRLKKISVIKTAAAKHDEDQKYVSAKDITAAILSKGSNSTYRKKQTVYSEGQRPNYVYYIEAGKVKVFRVNPEGKEFVCELFNAGDFFGYTSVLEKTNYKENAEALETSELIVIPAKDFEEMVETDPYVSKKFIRLLAKNVSEKEDQLLGLAYNSLRKKVAEALLLLYRKYDSGKGKPFTIDISRENLATIAATAKESLIRTLTDFKNEKLVSIHDGVITLLDIHRLTNLAN